MKKGDWSVLQKKGTIVRIPKKVLDSPYPHISLSIQTDRHFVAKHTYFSVRYPLFCVNRTTSKIVWKAEITPDDGGARGFSGGWWHCVEIIPQEKTVIVFGAVYDALYVVGLNGETGKELFRFSSWSRR